MLSVLFIFIYFSSYNCELYKKEEVPSALWNNHVFKSIDYAKSKIECGSICKIESACNSFQYEGTCFLIDMENEDGFVSDQSGEEVYLSVSKYSPSFKILNKQDQDTEILITEFSI